MGVEAGGANGDGNLAGARFGIRRVFVLELRRSPVFVEC
jgi:hypothetical protein